MGAKIELEAIGVVRGGRAEVVNDDWGPVEAHIELDERLGPEALSSLEQFSHAVIVFHFDQVDRGTIEVGSPSPPQQQGLAAGRYFCPAGKEPTQPCRRDNL